MKQMKDCFKIDIHSPRFELNNLVIILISKDTNLKLHPTPGTFHEQTPLQTYCTDLWQAEFRRNWCNLSNQHYKEIVEFKINIIGRQWTCFTYAACIPTHQSTQNNNRYLSIEQQQYLSIEFISLCHINICVKRWDSP